MKTRLEDLPPAARALIVAYRQARKKDRRRLRARPEQINERYRFGRQRRTKQWAAARFAAAMRRYLERWNCRGWTCGEVLDVLTELGYRSPEPDFEISVHEFTVAIAALKREKKRNPSCLEVLRVAMRKGWRAAASEGPE